MKYISTAIIILGIVIALVIIYKHEVLKSQPVQGSYIPIGMTLER